MTLIEQRNSIPIDHLYHPDDAVFAVDGHTKNVFGMVPGLLVYFSVESIIAVCIFNVHNLYRHYSHTLIKHRGS